MQTASEAPHARICALFGLLLQRIMRFSITAPDTALSAALQAKIDGTTKPLGALGRLERLAVEIGLAQQALSPRLSNPHILICAGDHGALRDPEGARLSAFTQDVTWQMVENFLAGGAAINVFARQAGIALKVVDAGVNHDFGRREGLVDAKIGYGTRSYLAGPAMGDGECGKALAHGAAIVAGLAEEGCNILGFGEMGIGNTASAALLTHFFAGAPVADCVGRGTGLDDAGLAHKRAILGRVAAAYRGTRSAQAVLAQFGGFEIAMLCGAMLAAAQRRMLLLIDGFIVTAALLAAVGETPAVLPYCIFSHRSQERGHAVQLAHLGVEPLLDLDLRLGEGTGAAIAYPLVAAAVAMLNEMASFDSAGVSRREA